MKVLIDEGYWARILCDCGEIFDSDATTEEGCARLVQPNGRIYLVTQCPHCLTVNESKDNAWDDFNLHYVCFACRIHFKGTYKCPGCKKQMQCVGINFKTPKKRDTKEWKRLEEQYRNK